MGQVGGHAQWRNGRGAGAGMTVYAAGLVGGQPVGTTDPSDAVGAVLEGELHPYLVTEFGGGLRISAIGDRVIAH